MMSALRSNVILHVFDWPYQMVTQYAAEISQLGYQSVLISPPMKSLKQPSGTRWWQRYQPQDYRVIDNQLGNLTDLKAMIAKLNQHDIQVYVDVVFNHMANESDLRDDLQYPSQQEMMTYQSNAEYFQQQRLFGDLSQPLFTEDDFVEAFGIEDWQDKWQVQNGRITGGPEDPGLPTLRDNAHVVLQQQNYIKALRELGVKGFRIDAAKHMSLEHLTKVWTDELCKDVHIFGEIITDGGATKQEYDTFLQPYLEQTQLGAYDFPLFQTLYDALQSKGRFKSLIDPYSLGQALDEHRAVTFAITHDIPNNQVFENLVLEEAEEWLAYGFILGRDGGVPLIYSDLDTSGMTNSERKPRWLSMWRDPKLAAMIAFHNRMHGCAMKVVEASDDLLVFTRGKHGIVVLNKSVRPQTVSIVANGQWRECLSDTRFVVEGERLEFHIAARTCAMFIAESE